MSKDPFLCSPLIAKKRAVSLEMSPSQSLLSPPSLPFSPPLSLTPPILPFSLPSHSSLLPTHSSVTTPPTLSSLPPPSHPNLPSHSSLPLPSHPTHSSHPKHSPHPYSIGVSGLTSLSIPSPPPISPLLSSTTPHTHSHTHSHTGPQKTGFSPSSKKILLPTPVCISLQNPVIYGTSSPLYSHKKNISNENFLLVGNKSGINTDFHDRKEHEKISESGCEWRKTFCSTDSELDVISPTSTSLSDSVSSSYNNTFEKLYPKLSSNIDNSEIRNFHSGSEIRKVSTLTEMEMEMIISERMCGDSDLNYEYKKVEKCHVTNKYNKINNNYINTNNDNNNCENFDNTIIQEIRYKVNQKKIHDNLENDEENLGIESNDKNDEKKRIIQELNKLDDSEKEKTTVKILDENGKNDGRKNTETERVRCKSSDWTYVTRTDMTNAHLPNFVFQPFLSAPSSSISIAEYASYCSTLSTPSPNLRQCRDNDNVNGDDNNDDNSTEDDNIINDHNKSNGNNNNVEPRSHNQSHNEVSSSSSSSSTTLPLTLLSSPLHPPILSQPLLHDTTISFSPPITTTTSHTTSNITSTSTPTIPPPNLRSEGADSCDKTVLQSLHLPLFPHTTAHTSTTTSTSTSISCPLSSLPTSLSHTIIKSHDKNKSDNENENKHEKTNEFLFVSPVHHNTHAINVPHCSTHTPHTTYTTDTTQTTHTSHTTHTQHNHPTQQSKEYSSHSSEHSSQFKEHSSHSKEPSSSSSKKRSGINTPTNTINNPSPPYHHVTYDEFCTNCFLALNYDESDMIMAMTASFTMVRIMVNFVLHVLTAKYYY